MRIVVPIKQTPDLVEELELNDDGTDVDREFLKFVLSEWDDQAIEEALLVKVAAGGEVVVVGFGDPDVELSLYTAIAKGADRAVNLTGLGEGWIDSHTRAAALAEWLGGQEVDLVLAGVQAVDDLAAARLLHEERFFDRLVVPLGQHELQELPVDVRLVGVELELFDEVRRLLDGNHDAHGWAFQVSS